MKDWNWLWKFWERLWIKIKWLAIAVNFIFYCLLFIFILIFYLVDIFVLQNVNGEMVQKFLKPSEIDVYLKEIEKEEADEKASKDKNKEY